MAADTAPRRRALGEALFITVALGHVLGSSICNVPGILGVTALIHRIKIPAEIARFAIWALDAATTALLLFLRTRWMLSR